MAILFFTTIFFNLLLVQIYATSKNFQINDDIKKYPMEDWKKNIQASDTKIDDINFPRNKLITNPNNQTNRKKLRLKRNSENITINYEVAVLYKKNEISGDIRTRIPITPDAKYVYFLISGMLRKCLLRSPAGNIFNMLQEAEENHSDLSETGETQNRRKTQNRRSFILNLPKIDENTIETATNTWTLITSGQNYNISIFAIRKYEPGENLMQSTFVNLHQRISNNGATQGNDYLVGEENFRIQNTAEWRPLIVKREYPNVINRKWNGQMFLDIPPTGGFLNREFATANFRQIPVTIDVNPRSTLYALPGEITTVSFDVRNYGPEILLLSFDCFYQQFPCNVQPKWIRLFPSKTAPVIVTLRAEGGEGSSSIITLQSQGLITITKKSYLYIGKPRHDTTKPDIDYAYNNDCENADTGETCRSKQWSVDIVAQDYTSGLLKVWSEPPALIFISDYIAGTKDPVNARFTASCCDPKVDIAAMDLKGNVYKRTLDVQHQHLSLLEWTTIVLGIMLLATFIAVIIYCSLRWRRKRNERSFLNSN